MGPGVAFLIVELVKLGLNRVNQAGKFNTLTEDEAKAEFQAIAAGLPTTLPTPEQLEEDASTGTGPVG